MNVLRDAPAVRMAAMMRSASNQVNWKFATARESEACPLLKAGVKNSHQLQMALRRAGDIEVIELAGTIESLSFAGLATELNRVIGKGVARVILDCRHLTYISSAELKELLDLSRYARARGGDVKCVGLSPTIQQVANLVSSGDTFEYFDDLAVALRSFRGRHISDVR